MYDIIKGQAGLLVMYKKRLLKKIVVIHKDALCIMERRPVLYCFKWRTFHNTDSQRIFEKL